MSSIARQDIILSVVMRDVLKKVPGETDLKTDAADVPYVARH